MKNYKFDVEVDTSLHLDDNGISVCIFLGENSDTPVMEEVFPIETMIENHFESFLIGNQLRGIDLDDTEKSVIKLEQMAKYARNMFEDYKAESI
tara:strand:- start:273 stop:554 length:282 start_codon:yes stop_codon:yes gene_type:complete